MDLLLIRHAEAEDIDGKTIKNDFDRPLTDFGQKQAKNLGKFLSKTLSGPVLLASSPLVRAHQTAQILKKHAEKVISEWETWEEVGIPADWEAMRNRLGQSQAPGVILVGHMDEIAHLAEKLIGSTEGTLSFKKGAAALFRWNGTLRWQTARLKWWIDTDLLDSMSS